MSKTLGHVIDILGWGYYTPQKVVRKYAPVDSRISVYASCDEVRAGGFGDQAS